MSSLKIIPAIIALALFSVISADGKTRITNDSIPKRDVDFNRLIHHFSVNFGADYVASSILDELTKDLEPEYKQRVNTSLPVALKYSFSFTDSRIPHFLPGGYQGIGLQVLNLGALQTRGMEKSSIKMGYPVALYVFQGGPFNHFGKKLSLDYEWNFGATFGWKPYSASNRDFNLIVGSRVNAYLNLSIGLTYMINPEISIFTGVAASHFSNGNTSWPNPGINAFGLRFGINYTFNPSGEGTIFRDLNHNPSNQTDSETVKDKRKIEYNLTLWGASRKRVYKGGEEPILLKGHFACAGISFSPMWKFNQWWRVGVALDLQWDQSSDKKRTYISGTTPDDIKFSKPDFFRQSTVGLSAHGELRMPIFGVNIGCGYNILAPWENRGSYQNISLKTYIGETFFINVGYQLRNFHQQSSLMLGAGVTL